MVEGRRVLMYPCLSPMVVDFVVVSVVLLYFVVRVIVPALPGFFLCGLFSAFTLYTCLCVCSFLPVYSMQVTVGFLASVSLMRESSYYTRKRAAEIDEPRFVPTAFCYMNECGCCCVRSVGRLIISSSFPVHYSCLSHLLVSSLSLNGCFRPVLSRVCPPCAHRWIPSGTTS